MDDRSDRRRSGRSSRPRSSTPVRYVLQRLGLKPLVWAETKVQVEGRDQVRKLTGPVVVVANHSSHLDTPLVLCALPARLGSRVAVGAAGDYFFDVRWRAGITGLVFNAFPVDRGTGSGARRGVAAELLDAGTPLLIFPEGTRSHTGEMGPFKPGAAALCINRGVPCLPVGIAGAFTAMPRGRNWPAPGRPAVRVSFGAPLYPHYGESPTEFTDRIRTAVADLAAGRGERAPSEARDRNGGSVTGTEPVRHMKWWGWGEEGIAFSHEDKPALAPFVLAAVDLDITTPGPPPPAFEDLPVPVSLASSDLLTALGKAVGPDHVHTGAMERVLHTYGKSLRDLLKIRAGLLPRVPDVVVYPGDEDEVAAVVDEVVSADAVLIPFGGGSNISGSLQPEETETRPVVSMDLGRLNRVLDIDEESGLARVQAGVLGPDIEAQLGVRGWTLGHFPDSFNHSTLGGWIATRSSGMQSDKYGDIADITRAVRVVQPGRVLVTRPVPSTSTGPSVREMVLGSEGRLGVITEATVQVHRVPPKRIILGYLFPTWQQGLEAMHAISVSDTHPSVTRISDGRETGFSFATRKQSAGLQSVASKGLQAFLARKGWDLSQMCLAFIGYEGGKDHVARQKREVKRIIKPYGGICIGAGPGALYDQKKFDTPYIRDFLLDRGACADVSETSAPWSQLLPLYEHTVAQAEKAFQEIGVKGWIMCHLSHSYHSGACLYFTFAFRHGADPIAEYDVVKRAVQQAFVDHAGTLSHHHAVGTEHSYWLAQDISRAGADLISGLFDAADPGRHLNPGKIVP